MNSVSVNVNEWQELRSQIPTWQEVFMNADTATKRVLVDKLIERIDITKDDIVIRFKININDFFQQPRFSDGFGVSQQRL